MTSSQKLTAASFPNLLVTAISENHLNNMPEVVSNTSSDYFSGNYDMLSHSQAFKQHEETPNPFGPPSPLRKITLLTLFQRYESERDSFCVPTNQSFAVEDARLEKCRIGGSLREENFQAIQEIFKGTHPELTLCTQEELYKMASTINSCKKRKEDLKKLDVSEEDADRYSHKYLNNLLSANDLQIGNP